METASMQVKGKPFTKSDRARPLRTALQFLVPITLLSFTIFLSHPYWFPSLQNLSQPLFNSLLTFLDRKFMFVLCNVILIFLSGDSSVLTGLPPNKRDIYGGYIIKKNEISLTQLRNMGDEPKSIVTKMGSLKKKQKEAETEREEVGAVERGEEEEKEEEVEAGEEEKDEEEEAEESQDGCDREDEEMDKRFDEFIARKHETWKRENHQLLKSSAPGK